MMPTKLLSRLQPGDYQQFHTPSKLRGISDCGGTQGGGGVPAQCAYREPVGHGQPHRGGMLCMFRHASQMVVERLAPVPVDALDPASVAQNLKGPSHVTRIFSSLRADL